MEIWHEADTHLDKGAPIRVFKLTESEYNFLLRVHFFLSLEVKGPAVKNFGFELDKIFPNGFLPFGFIHKVDKHYWSILEETYHNPVESHNENKIFWSRESLWLKQDFEREMLTAYKKIGAKLIKETKYE